MNFVDVTVQPESDGVSLMIGSTCLGKLRQPFALREDRRAIVGIRPERIEIAVASLGLPGKLEMIEPLGLGSVLHIRLGMQRLKAFTTESSPAQVNQPIGIAVAPANLLLFDPETGKRMRPRQ
jgi:multiple sugar transport system ATP-binding protein